MYLDQIQPVFTSLLLLCYSTPYLYFSLPFPCTVSPFLIPTESIYCYSCVHVCEIIAWSVDNLSGSTSQKKTDSPSHRRYLLTIAPQSEVELHAPSPSMAGFLVVFFSLYKSHASGLSCCEFLWVNILS